MRTLIAIFNRLFRRHETEALIKAMSWKDGSFDVTFKTPFAPAIAAAATEFFEDAGGTNFVTFDFLDYGVTPPRGYTVTVRRYDRQTPEKIALVYEQALKQIIAELPPTDSHVSGIAFDALDKFGRAPQATQKDEE